MRKEVVSNIGIFFEIKSFHRASESSRHVLIAVPDPGGRGFNPPRGVFACQYKNSNGRLFVDPPPPLVEYPA